MKYLIVIGMLISSGVASADTYDDFQSLVSFCGRDGNSNEQKTEDAKYCETYYRMVLFFDIDRKLKKINELPENVLWFKRDQVKNTQILASLYRYKNVLLETRSDAEGQVQSQCKDSKEFNCRLVAYSRLVQYIKFMTYSGITFQVEKLTEDYSPHKVD